jgi:hypothetical protein
MEIIQSVSSRIGIGPTVALVGRYPMGCAIAGLGVVASAWCASSKAKKIVTTERQREAQPELASLLGKVKISRCGEAAADFVREWHGSGINLGWPEDKGLCATLVGVRQSLLDEAIGYFLATYFKDKDLALDRDRWDKVIADECHNYSDGGTYIVDQHNRDLFIVFDVYSKYKNGGEPVNLTRLEETEFDQMIQWLEYRQTLTIRAGVERRRLGEAVLLLALTSLLVGAIWLKTPHPLHMNS